MSLPTRQCGYCREYKVWVWQGACLNDGSKVYTDNLGVRWAGKRCPSCERCRVRTALKLTKLEKDMALNQLKSSGYEPLSSSFPMKAKFGEKIQKVGLQFASMRGSKIVLEEAAVGQPADMYILIFRTVRLVSQQNWKRLNQEKFETISSL